MTDPHFKAESEKWNWYSGPKNERMVHIKERSSWKDDNKKWKWNWSAGAQKERVVHIKFRLKNLVNNDAVM